MSTQVRILSTGMEIEHVVDHVRCANIISMVSSNLGPHASEAIDCLLSLMRIRKNDDTVVQKLVKEATNLAVAISVLALKSDNPGSEDWKEEILGNMVKTLKIIQHFTKDHIGKSILRRAIDTRKVEKYRETLAGMRDQILHMALLRMSPPEDSILDSTGTDTIVNPTAADNNPSGRASPGKKAGEERDARTKLKEANVAETSAKHTVTATDQVALETSADGSVSTTIDTPTPAGTRTSELRGRTTADTDLSSSSSNPRNVNAPSGNSGYYSLAWYPLPYSLVPVSPSLHPPSVYTTVIDYSHHETTYGSYSNHGQHMTNHGTNATYIHRNTYSSSRIHGYPNIDNQLNEQMTTEDRSRPRMYDHPPQDGIDESLLMEEDADGSTRKRPPTTPRHKTL